jgi:hypothetical protein
MDNIHRPCRRRSKRLTESLEMSNSSLRFLNDRERRYLASPRVIADTIKIRRSLYEALRLREVDRVIYFHADHFEPWREETAEYQLEQVEIFAEQSAQFQHSRRLTLFYQPALPFFFKDAVQGHLAARVICDAGDAVAFLPAADGRIELGKRMMDRVLKAGHEIQVHIHHEQFTASAHARTENAKSIQQWLHQSGSIETDEARFERYLQLALDETRKQSGLALDRWAFVHGNWALNGADPSVCRLRNEILTLMKYGCYGDFTFPAPHRGVNPTCTEPYTIRPFAAVRCQDSEEAAPLMVRDHPQALNEPGRFLIWAAPIDARYCSLDYMSKSARQVLADIERMIINWIIYSPKIGNTLYVKTHAHSMSWANFEALDKPVIPHAHPEVQRGFSALMSACEHAGVKLEFLSIDEMRAELERAPVTGIAAFGAPFEDSSQPLSVSMLNFLLSDAAELVGRRSRETALTVDPSLLRRAERGEILSPAELEAFEALAEEIDGSTPVVEIGPFGRCALLFALRGNPSCMFDENRDRASFAREVLLTAQRSNGIRLPPIAVVSGKLGRGDMLAEVPKSMRQSPVAIVTNTSSPQRSPEAFDSACQELKGFAVVYINLRKFGAPRQTEAEFNELIAQLATGGLAFEQRTFDSEQLVLCRFRPQA